MDNIFTFTPQNKKNVWTTFTVALQEARNNNPKGFEVVIRKIKKERGEQALKAYWYLIGVVREYINKDCGNNFTKEEVSDYFKMQAGHKSRLNGVEVPRSIANNKGCTYEDMKNIVDYILRFGAENNIRDCEITTMQEQEYKAYYGIE